MRRIIYYILITVALFTACGGTTSGGKRQNPSSFQARIGTATAPDVRIKTNLLLTRYQFELVRFEESSHEWYFETSWKHRELFDDERNESVAAARTRLIIRSRPRTRTSLGGTADIHNVQVYGENQLRLRESGKWINAPLSDELMDYFTKFSRDLETELRSGVGRF